jgi:hypothetical protein
MEPVVKHDVPAPSRVPRYRALYTMEVGDSITYTDYNYNALRSTITYLHIRYAPKHFTTHRDKDGSITVWRVA